MEIWISCVLKVPCRWRTQWGFSLFCVCAAISICGGGCVHVFCHMKWLAAIVCACMQLANVSQLIVSRSYNVHSNELADSLSQIPPPSRSLPPTTTDGYVTMPRWWQWWWWWWAALHSHTYEGSMILNKQTSGCWRRRRRRRRLRCFCIRLPVTCTLLGNVCACVCAKHARRTLLLETRVIKVHKTLFVIVGVLVRNVAC